jgi:hypothetical protein
VTVRADNRLADAPMTPVDCQRCAATVLVRKSSLAQTSVQWTGSANAACLERREADKLAAHGTRGLFLACSALRESIVEAVRDGALIVVDDSTDSVHAAGATISAQLGHAGMVAPKTLIAEQLG